MNRLVVLSAFAAAMAAGCALTLLSAESQAVSAQAPSAETPGANPGANPPVARPPTAEARLAQFGSRGVGVHDPSTIIQCKDEYWTFYTGRAAPSYHSKDLIHWQRGPATFARSPSWVAQAVPANRSGLDFWAPDVTRVGDRYMLFYSVSTFGKNTSAIGVATNPTLDPADAEYQWTDGGIVVQSTDRSDFNTIDPAVTLDPEGNLWMAFGSFWSGIRMIQLDPKTGKRIAPDSPMYRLAYNESIEAAFIYRHDDTYYLFVNWGACCRGVNSTYNIRVGRSRKITGPYVDKEGKDLVEGGGTLLLATDGPFIGPGHAGIIEKDGAYWISMHFYDGTRRGASTLAIRPLTWADDGWPVVGETPQQP